MAGFFHHIGTFLLFCATIFLLITTISAPVINSIGLLTVNLPDGAKGSEVSFGTFGYCLQDARGSDKDECISARVGYDPAAYMNGIDGTLFSGTEQDTTRGLTKVMILHPIATFLNFLAFGMALSAGVFGSFVASLIALVSFLVTLVALVCDFVLFGIIKSNVNSRLDNNLVGESVAYFSVGMWTLLVGAICSLLGTIVVFFTCCSGRIKKRRETRKTEGYTSPPRTRRRWFRRR